MKNPMNLSLWLSRLHTAGRWHKSTHCMEYEHSSYSVSDSTCHSQHHSRVLSQYWLDMKLSKCLKPASKMEWQSTTWCNCWRLFSRQKEAYWQSIVSTPVTRVRKCSSLAASLPMVWACKAAIANGDFMHTSHTRSNQSSQGSQLIPAGDGPWNKTIPTSSGRNQSNQNSKVTSSPTAVAQQEHSEWEQMD